MGGYGHRTKVFGAVTANHYGADYQINAISGRGVVRNYNGSKHDTLPEAYPYVLLDKEQKYEDAAWKPQVVVIALGTNDFSTALNAGERWKTRDELHADYERTYVEFLQGLRARDRKALIIVWATDAERGARSQQRRRRLCGRCRRRGTGTLRSWLSAGAAVWGLRLGIHRLMMSRRSPIGLVRAIDADGKAWPAFVVG